MDIRSLRKEYKRGDLSDKSLVKEPMQLFERWFNQALHSDIEEANAMTLASASMDGKSSARIVLLKGFSERGFTFFTNYNSRKGKELITNPNAALLFFWKELERQVRVEGTVHKTSSQESDDYFSSRTLESRISAVVSPQSEPLPSRRHLEDRWIEELKKVDLQGITRPSHWGGFILVPDQIEFWQGRPNRLHDRILYKRDGNQWTITRLAP